MGLPLVSTLRRRAWIALPLLLATSGVALLAEPASPAAAATRSPALQLCVLDVTCVNLGPTPSATASTTPPLLGINIGTGASTAPALPSVSVGASVPVTLPVKVPSSSVQVSVPASIGVVVAPSDDPSSSVDEHVVTGSVTTVPAPADGIAVPSVVGTVGDDDGSASPSVSDQPAVVQPSSAPQATAAAAPVTVAPTTTAAVQAVAPTTIRPVAVSPKLIQHVVSHSVGGVLLLLAACLVFIGVEISADRRDPKLVRAAQKSEWLRFEDPNKTSGGVV